MTATTSQASSPLSAAAELTLPKTSARVRHLRIHSLEMKLNCFQLGPGESSTPPVIGVISSRNANENERQRMPSAGRPQPQTAGTTSLVTGSTATSSRSGGLAQDFYSELPSWASADHDIRFVKALYPFVSADPTELEFEGGDIIRVVERSPDRWWKGDLNGRSGSFPIDHVVSNLAQ